MRGDSADPYCTASGRPPAQMPVEVAFALGRDADFQPQAAAAALFTAAQDFSIFVKPMDELAIAAVHHHGAGCGLFSRR